MVPKKSGKRMQQAGVVAGSAAVMFAAAVMTDGLFSGTMLVAGIATILAALWLYVAAYREKGN